MICTIIFQKKKKKCLHITKLSNISENDLHPEVKHISDKSVLC